MRIVIVVPLAPPRELLPNARRRGRGGSHWSVQAELSDAMRIAARGAALNARYQMIGNVGGGPLFDRPVIVTYDVVWPHERYKDHVRLPDHDAIPTAAKACLDGIVDAGIILDDSPAYVDEVRARGRRGMRDEQGVTVVTIEEAG